MNIEIRTNQKGRGNHYGYRHEPEITTTTFRGQMTHFSPAIYVTHIQD